MVAALFDRLARLGSDVRASARSLAIVWAFGATCLTATIIVEHPRDADVTGLALVVAIAYPIAAVMFVRAATIPAVALEAVTYLGQGLITALTFFWGAPEAPYLWFHVWLVVHSFHFLPPARATRQIVCAAILFVVGTVATHASYPAAMSIIGVGSIVIIGLLVGVFRARVDQLVEELARNAATDPLTGLANRRAFTDRYALEQERRARNGAEGALLMLDCDAFKERNDTYGHAAGDEALQRVAAAIAQNIRKIDTAARLGGDEFAVLLGAADTDTAVAIADRIRRAVAEDPAADGMTLSVGIAELPSAPPLELGVAVAAADRALYRSKDRGGDCVSVGATLVRA